jgi:hypothetical protein
MMITANEAKEIYDKSGAEVADYLKLNVEQAVKSAAEGGKRSTIVYLGNTQHWTVSQSDTTPLEKAIVSRLRELGYGAVIRLYGDKYVPRGLQDDNGEGPAHQNYGIHISW